MSYFCVNGTITNLFWMHCKYNQTLNTCGPCLMCSKYQRGDIPPRYLVPTIRYGLEYIPGDEFDPDMWLYLVDWSDDDRPLVLRIWIEGDS